MLLPEALLLSDLLRRRVRCDQGLDHGAGVLVWMHPPVHRVLGWVSKPSAFGSRRQVWRLNQLRGLAEQEALVVGEPAETELATVERLPTLIEAVLLNRRQEPIGLLADAAFEPQSGRIRHYLVSRSDPRLPGSSRWRLTPDRISDQQPGQVVTVVEGLEDLPLARASVRQELLRRSRRWRDQVQQVGDRFEQRLEGWLEESPWTESESETEAEAEAQPSSPEPWEDDWQEAPHRSLRERRSQSRDHDRRGDGEDPWI